MDRQGKRKRHSTPDSELHLPKRHSVTLSDTDHQQSSAPSSAFYPSQLHPTGQALLTSDSSLHGWHSGPHRVAPGVAPMSSDVSYQAASYKSMTEPHGPSSSHPHPHTSASSPQVSPQSLQAYGNSPLDWYNGPYLVSPGVAPTFGDRYQAPPQSNGTTLLGPSYSHLYPYTTASSPQTLVSPQNLGAARLIDHDCPNGLKPVSPGVAPTFGSSGDCYQMPFQSSATALPGSSYGRLHPYTSASSPQVHPVGPQPPQISGLDNISHGYRSVGSSLRVYEAASASGPPGDPWPFPIPVLELPENESQLQDLVSSLGIYHASSQTPCEGSDRDRWDGSTESHPEISRIVASWSPSGGLQSLAPDMRTWRSNVNSASRSSTPVSELSATTAPVHSSPAHSDRLPSPSSAPSGSESHCDTPNPWAPYGNNASVRTQLENAGMNLPVPPASEPTPSPSAGQSDGKKKSIISATRLILRTASTALKFSPIPFLPHIPDLLLTLLQVYGNVSGNNEALTGLSDDVQNAYNTILRPLQLWTGHIPPEVIFPLKDLHLALEDQVKRIKPLESQSRKPLKKIFTAGSLAQSINGVRTCISEALSRFATVATTLNLLNTIQVSVDYELSKLPKVGAEYYRVKSKSECLETTRDTIRSSILEYLRDPKNRFVWLRGSPGTGKTAISMSVASTLDKQRTLAASFFWDKNQEGTGLDSIERFPSTLARQLAAFNAEYKSLLIRQLRDPASFSSIDGSAAEKEVKAWIINPMRELGGVLSLGKGRPVIVLDGLDECGNPDVLASLTRLVLLLDQLPSTFAILVSCRPEPQVVSAWARVNPHLSIAHEDMDQIAEDENSHTIRCMVEKGLQDCFMESPWKPTKKDLDAFSSACRGLPIIASTRIRDVLLQIECGSVLKTEFDYYRNLIDAPRDLNSEYLRILRRAYLQHRPKIDPHIAKKYREVVGMMIVARRKLSVYDLSQLLGLIPEHEVHSILKPISSIIDLPSVNKKPVKFYHATVKEFITGIPIGKKKDKVFFISDKKGYSIGLQLLRFLNGVIERNEFGFPTELPLGDEEKWKSKTRRIRQPNHIDYVLTHLFQHLDPSLLFSRESNYLQREFEQFWTQNLVSLWSAGGDTVVPSDWNQFKVSPK
ncbi:uncharacterized protein EI90DRAFT_1052858 [Cantharellus anzutake]|uniref:uncharacterized protein n=1 Tax=Cantharellus anzutake TaxID=1750568 RepID=UPI0019088F53|nr:uncharacterized protein EI90DRAFT_1052858 [Cantharellus anzutake]KAF8311108.1 hypothetical protein EI90DRAFT_1052858 [Cantharellus anzutake]